MYDRNVVMRLASGNVVANYVELFIGTGVEFSIGHFIASDVGFVQLSAPAPVEEAGVDDKQRRAQNARFREHFRTLRMVAATKVPFLL